MITVRRPLTRTWSSHHPMVTFTPGFPGRPVHGPSWPGPYQEDTMSGPSYKGMDPSDPSTYVRPWNPQPGMVARLNFDGAQKQAETPTGGVQRGKTSGGRLKLRVGGVNYAG